jgi:hypothetical protein
MYPAGHSMNRRSAPTSARALVRKTGSKPGSADALRTSKRLPGRVGRSESVDVVRRYIACAVQDAPDLQYTDVHDVEDQIAAEHDAPNAFAQPWSQRCRPRKFGNLPAAIAQLGDECDRAPWVVASDEAADILNVPFGLTAEAVSHRARRRFVMRRYFVSSRSSTGLTWLLGEAAGTALVEQTAQFELPLPLLVFQQPERVAHDFAGVVVAPAGHLGVDEFLEVLAEAMRDRCLPRSSAPGSSWTGLSAAIMCWFIPATRWLRFAELVSIARIIAM